MITLDKGHSKPEYTEIELLKLIKEAPPEKKKDLLSIYKKLYGKNDRLTRQRNTG